MRPMPAASRARQHVVELGAKSGKSRWQWLSTSIVSSPPRFRLDVAREYRRAAAARCRGRSGARPPSAAKSRSVGGTPSRSSSFPPRPARRLRQDRDLPDHLRGDVEHRALRPDRSWRAPTAPRRRNTGWPRHHRPDLVQHLVQLLVAMASRALPIIPSAAARIVWSAAVNVPGFGMVPPQLLPTIESERCARLPRSLARSALCGPRSPRGCSCRPGRTAPRAGRNSAAGRRHRHRRARTGR